jgi:prevent-host-death family protein
MLSVPVFDAKARLSELLAQVQAGEEITITKHGVPIARLTAPLATSKGRQEATQRRTVDAAFAALATLCDGVALDISVREAIDSGRD